MPDGTFHLEIITPQKVLISEEIHSVEIPGTHGEFQVLHGHTPFLTALRIGAVWYVKDGKRRVLSVCGGFCEVLPDKTVILAPCAEHAASIDKKRAMASRTRAVQRLASNDPAIDRARAQAALERAIIRIQVADFK